MGETYGGALEGLRVLDVAGTIAAGYCGKLFADHGAEVVLAEPPEGFPTRHMPPFAPGVSAPEASGMHLYLSTNKRSAVCQGPDELLALARDVSVVIDAAVGDDRPLSTAQLAAVSPNALLVSITWFGQDGPYANFLGTDAICQALTSQIDWLGEPNEEPMMPSGFQAQFTAGVTAFVGAMGQVLARELGSASGSDHLDVSILESNLCFAEIEAIRAFKGMSTRTRIGVNRFRTTYPLGIYPCSDGWLGVTVLTPSQWRGFCQLLGLERLAAIGKYREGAARLRDADEIDRQIAESVRDRSARELAERGQALGVPLAIVPTMEQLVGVDQYVERGAFGDVRHPDVGAVQLPVTPFRLYGCPAIAGGSVARLGADTEELLALAGVSQ